MEGNGGKQHSLRKTALETLSQKHKMRIGDLEKETVKLSGEPRSSVHSAIWNLDRYFPAIVYKSHDGQLVYVGDDTQRKEAIIDEATSYSLELRKEKDLDFGGVSYETEDLLLLVSELGRRVRYFELPLEDKPRLVESFSIVKIQQPGKKTEVYSFLGTQVDSDLAKVQGVRLGGIEQENVLSGVTFLQRYLPNLKDQICRYADNQITTLDQLLTTGLIAEITNQLSLLGIVAVSIVSVILLILLKAGIKTICEGLK